MHGLHRLARRLVFLLVPLALSLSPVSMAGCFNGSSQAGDEAEGAQSGATDGEVGQCSAAELQEMLDQGKARCEGVVPPAIPDSCFDFLVDGKLSLPHAPDPHNATTVGHVIIENQTIVELGGEPCHELYPGHIYDCTTSYPSVALDECRRAFVCGCCGTINVGIVEQVVPSGKYLALDVRVPASCFDNPNLIGGLGYLEQITRFENSSGGGSSGGVNSAACQDCLSACQGYSSCCTGVGCICEDECKSTSKCGPGLTYCCGPQGDCFCWEDCPY